MLGSCGSLINYFVFHDKLTLVEKDHLGDWSREN